MCAVLLHLPVCPVKSDELGNEKQVCVKCVDHSFIPPPPPHPTPHPDLCGPVFYDKGDEGRRVSRENTEGERG